MMNSQGSTLLQNVDYDEAVEARFRATMRKFPATVTVVTASDGIRDHGMTATAVTSVAMDPPSLLVCVNNKTLTHAMLNRQPLFCVNVLSADQSAISDDFGGSAAPEDRFKSAEWVRDEYGMLVLSSAHGNVICTRVGSMPFGTHTIFVGNVLSARVDDKSQPLLYADAKYHVSQPA